MKKTKCSYIFLTALIGLSLYIFFIKYPVKDYFIMKDTRYESSVYYINNHKKTKVLIIAGIHGNEIAGIEAAEKILRDKPDWANFIVIPKANSEAIKLKERNPYYMSDLNRAFPGRQNGTDTEILAYEIFKIIENEEPDFVIDLHEWGKKYDEDSRYLSNGLILSSLDLKFWQIVEKVYNKHILNNNSTKLMLSISPLNGSLNKEIAEKLDIPVLTIESNMNDNLEDRINFHLYTIENIIKKFEMDDLNVF